MRDIWNPWHGCVKISEGCQNCYMYFLDAQRDKSGADIFRVKNNFDYPLHKDKKGNYKIKSGEFIRVCMTSDFFLEQADEWRDEAWEIIRKRPDVIFILITKRPQRVEKSLPVDWGDGWENVFFHITAENQKRADERIPILLDLPFKHKAVMVAPFIGPVSIEKYLQKGIIEEVWCGGENYNGSRPLHYEWVERLSCECKNNDTTFVFFETGNVFYKHGKRIPVLNKAHQAKIAFLSDLNYKSSKPLYFDIPKINQCSQISLFQNILEDKEEKENKIFKFEKENCKYCASYERCAGCSNCGKCR